MPAKTAKSSERTPSRIGPAGKTLPSRPIALATIPAVTGASPVIITVRTPNSRNSAISSDESPRGGSLRAIIPASFTAPNGPIPTASTLKP